MAKSFTPWSLCIMQMRPLFRTLDDCPFTFIRIYTLSHTSGQYGPTNAKHSNTDLSILYRQQRLLCRGIVREQKRQCVRERRKERITERNFSFCHRLMHDAKPGCKGKPAVGRSVPEHLLRALPPTPMELISILYSAIFRLNSQKMSKTHP